MSGPHRDVADAAWRWVLTQLHRDGDGAWLTVAEQPARDGLHEGTGSLALALAEVRRLRPWTEEEQQLATTVAAQVRARTAGLSDVSWFDGLVSDIVVLGALGEPGAEATVERLLALADAGQWPIYSDVTMGTAAIIAGGLDATAHGVDRGRQLAERAADALLAEAEPTEDGGLNWLFVPRRKVPQGKENVEMPNWSHGLAGMAATLARAGAALDRPDLVDAARRGAEHLVTLRDPGHEGFVVPRRIPWKEGMDEVTWNWCHGPAGTVQLFVALAAAGVPEVAGQPVEVWARACLDAVRASGVPERRRPGFWDNDGRCCGTAGVGEAFLDAWEREARPEDLAFATVCADALVERAVRDDGHAYWRFVEHRNEDPLLPPAPGWMQGAAGIAAYLWRVSRTLDSSAA